jgi:hypothetical protein
MTEDDLFDPGPPADDAGMGDDSSAQDDTSGDDSGMPSEAPKRSNGGGGYAQELVSKKILAKQRTFYIDLKESHNGKFIKMSEVSRGGQRSTIMFDIEDLGEIVKALQEIESAA